MLKSIHITKNGKTSNYINHCVSFFESEPVDSGVASSKDIELVAEGRSATKAIIVAEIVKSKCLRPVVSSCTIGEVQGHNAAGFLSTLRIHLTNKTIAENANKKRSSREETASEERTNTKKIKRISRSNC